MSWPRQTAVAVALSAAAIASGAAVAGCRLGTGPNQRGAATLVVTRDFGGQRLAAGRQEPIRGGETVMRFLQRTAHVKTAYGGNFVTEIDGLKSRGGGQQDGQHDWFYYVNGVEAGVGAGAKPLSKGDCVQWDYHDWSAAMRVPAIVGCFPEPFVNGIDGRRLPVRVNCGAATSVCDTVEQLLDAVGVAAGVSALGVVQGKDVLRVVVAPWRQAKLDPAARLLGGGPRASGVYARFVGEQRANLQLLDPHGRFVRTLGAGTGLVAATRRGGDQPTWFVIGTDDQGTERAAQLLSVRTLRDSFALAITKRGPERLPVLSR